MVTATGGHCWSNKNNAMTKSLTVLAIVISSVPAEELQQKTQCKFVKISNVSVRKQHVEWKIA